MTPRHEMPTPGPAMQIAAGFNALVPVLKTERLVMRGPKLSDFPAYVDIVCTDRGTHVSGPMSREDAWFDFAGMSSNWMLHGHGGWTIEEVGTGLVLGFVLLGLEPGDREVELGFLLTRAAEGKGLAHEAATAVRDWAKTELGLAEPVSYIDPGNERSILLAERLGASRDRTAEAAFDEPILVYRHRSGGRA